MSKPTWCWDRDLCRLLHESFNEWVEHCSAFAGFLYFLCLVFLFLCLSNIILTLVGCLKHTFYINDTMGYCRVWKEHPCTAKEEPLCQSLPWDTSFSLDPCSLLATSAAWTTDLQTFEDIMKTFVYYLYIPKLLVYQYIYQHTYQYIPQHRDDTEMHQAVGCCGMLWASLSKGVRGSSVVVLVSIAALSGLVGGSG